MSEETPIEAYQAFVSTKPTEFDAFIRKWKEEHPQKVEAQILPAILPDVAIEKPKRVRKLVAATPSSTTDTVNAES